MYHSFMHGVRDPNGLQLDPMIGLRVSFELDGIRENDGSLKFGIYFTFRMAHTVQQETSWFIYIHLGAVALA